MQTQVIEMHEHPTKALKEKKQSSIAIRFSITGNWQSRCIYKCRQYRCNDGGCIVQH